MARSAMPINILQATGKKHLTKKEIEERKAVEESFELEGLSGRAPSFLDKVARDEYNRLKKELAPSEILKSVDNNTLAIYCQLFSRVKKAEEMIKEHGELIRSKSGDPAVSPYVNIANKCYGLMRQYAIELGLTPCARAKMAIKGKPKKEPSKFEKDFGDL